jgi:hypothetical protein
VVPGCHAFQAVHVLITQIELRDDALSFGFGPGCLLKASAAVKKPDIGVESFSQVGGEIC